MNAVLLIELLTVLLLVSLVSILVIVLTSTQRKKRVSIGAEGIARTGVEGTETAVVARRRSGGGAGGIVSRGPADSYTDLVDEESSVLPSYSASPREPLDAIRSKVLISLIRHQAIPLDQLEQMVKADKEYIVKVLQDLEKQGLARVEGGVVHISERGERIITKLREKYAEKENWYEAL